MATFKVYLKTIVFFFILFCSKPACADELIKSSDAKKPAWTNSLPADEENLWFVGSENAARELPSGKLSALKNACAKILDSFGISESASDFGTKKEDLFSKLSPGLKPGEKTMVAGLKILDGYYEEWLRDDGSNYYNVHILRRYDLKAHEERKKLYDEEYRAVLNKALEVFKTAREKESAGEIAPVLEGYSTALKALSQIAEISGKSKLRKDILTRVQNILSNIDFGKYENEDEQSVINGVKTPIMMTAAMKKDETTVPLSGFPVFFYVLKGNAGLEEARVKTDERGIAKCGILKLYSDKCLIRASIDVPVSEVELPGILFEVEPEKSGILFDKSFLTSFEAAGISDKVGFMDSSGNLAAILNIRITPPGSTGNVFFELTKPESPQEAESVKTVFNLPEGAGVSFGSESLSFTPAELEAKRDWCLNISFVGIRVKVVNYTTKKYYSTFTAPFAGFEKLALRVLLLLNKS